MRSRARPSLGFPLKGAALCSLPYLLPAGAQSTLPASMPEQSPAQLKGFARIFLRKCCFFGAAVESKSQVARLVHLGGSAQHSCVAAFQTPPLPHQAASLEFSPFENRVLLTGRVEGRCSRDSWRRSVCFEKTSCSRGALCLCLGSVRSTGQLTAGIARYLAIRM